MIRVYGEGQVGHFVTVRRALVVDDNATNRRILSTQLRTWGVVVAEAPEGDEALRWISKERFDFAILDLQMPGMDGLTLASRIHAYVGPAFPIVILSSAGLLDRDVASTGIAACIAKPAKSSQLRETLRTILVGYAHPPLQPDATVGEPSAPTPLRILIAEDNAVNQRVAVRILDRMGHRADIATNGTEVLEAMTRQRYDVVLMDIRMPEMDGMEATKRIRERWPGDQGPWIISMTANAMPGDREACLAAGMDDYVSKPVRLQDVQAAFARFAERADASKAAA